MISQSEAPAPEEIEVHKHQRDTDSFTSSLSSKTGKTGLIGGTRVSVTPENAFQRRRSI